MSPFRIKSSLVTVIRVIKRHCNIIRVYYIGVGKWANGFPRRQATKGLSRGLTIQGDRDTTTKQRNNTTIDSLPIPPLI